jgi:hypothetical protein
MNIERISRKQFVVMWIGLDRLSNASFGSCNGITRLVKLEYSSRRTEENSDQVDTAVLALPVRTLYMSIDFIELNVHMSSTGIR